jgi:hypothetical protein
MEKTLHTSKANTEQLEWTTEPPVEEIGTSQGRSFEQ